MRIASLAIDQVVFEEGKDSGFVRKIFHRTTKQVLVHSQSANAQFFPIRLVNIVTLAESFGSTDLKICVTKRPTTIPYAASQFVVHKLMIMTDEVHDEELFDL